MNKIISVIVGFSLISGSGAAMASGTERPNPFFGEGATSQIGFTFGQSVGAGGIKRMLPFNGWRNENLEIFNLTYAQPFEFFRLPGRQNLHVGMFVGYGDMHKDYTNPFAGISWDVAVLDWRGFYLAPGLGAYIKSEYTGRQDSLLMFGVKAAAGYNFGNGFSAEIFIKHMDNAGLTEIDGGYNFVGLEAFWNF